MGTQSSVVLLKLPLQTWLDIGARQSPFNNGVDVSQGEWSSGQERAVCKFGKMGVFEKKSLQRIPRTLEKGVVELPPNPGLPLCESEHRNVSRACLEL